jgi:hypothetical protein
MKALLALTGLFSSLLPSPSAFAKGRPFFKCPANFGNSLWGQYEKSMQAVIDEYADFGLGKGQVCERFYSDGLTTVFVYPHAVKIEDNAKTPEMPIIFEPLDTENLRIHTAWTLDDFSTGSYCSWDFRQGTLHRLDTQDKDPCPKLYAALASQARSVTDIRNLSQAFLDSTRAIHNHVDTVNALKMGDDARYEPWGAGLRSSPVHSPMIDATRVPNPRLPMLVFPTAKITRSYRGYMSKHLD